MQPRTRIRAAIEHIGERGRNAGIVDSQARSLSFRPFVPGEAGERQ
jgi:hypothetical protein